jgi:ABC-2 type transport system ATP-binding protein
MDEAESLCDRVAVVDHGKVIALGTPKHLISSLGAEHVIEFRVEEGRAAPSRDQLSRLPGVHDVHVEDGLTSLTASEVHLAIPALLAELGRSNSALSQLTTHHATLEDVFVSLTGRHLRDT